MAVYLEPVGTAWVKVAASIEVALAEHVVQVEGIDDHDGVGGLKGVIVPGCAVRVDKEHYVGEIWVIFEDVG